MTSIFKKIILLVALVLLSGCGEPESASPQPDSEWYVKVMTYSEDGLKDTHNVLGQMQGSSDDFDRHDLVELRPFSESYMTLNFYHPEWDKDDAHYASDYHDLKYSSQDKWVFQVESNDLQRKMTLSWKEPTLIDPKKTAEMSQQMVEKLMKEMWFIDLKTQKVIKAFEQGIAQSYQFSMEGEEVRSFMWVLGVEPSVEDLNNYVQSEKEKKVDLEPSVKSMPQKSQNLLELQPPGHSKRMATPE